MFLKCSEPKKLGETPSINGEFSADFTGCDWILTDDEIRVMLKQFPNLQSCWRDNLKLL
jgi:hypothetical protein